MDLGRSTRVPEDLDVCTGDPTTPSVKGGRPVAVGVRGDDLPPFGLTSRYKVLDVGDSESEG